MNPNTNFESCNIPRPTGLLCHDKLEVCTQGQGDCKCNPGSEEYEDVLERCRKLRRKFYKEMTKLESSMEGQKMYLDDHCYCFAQQVEFSDKTSERQEKNLENFDECNYFWDSAPLKWSPKRQNFLRDEEVKKNYSDSDKMLKENILDFEEKVDFLFRIFKRNEPKFPPEETDEQSQKKETVVKKMINLFEFHKRLSAVEEGIEDLAMILEDLIKKKSGESLCANGQVDFEEMSVHQRIDYLKRKNDFMLGFVKNFLTDGSVEGVCSKLCNEPSDYELNQPSLNSKLDYGMKQNSKGAKKEGVLETLKKLRMRMLELREKKTDQLKKVKREKIAVNPLKSPRNKLEVISEQAELLLNGETGGESGDFVRKTEVGSLTSTEESAEIPLSVTSRILAEEAEFLKSSLDKVHFELLSKFDSTQRNFENATNLQALLRSENKKDDVGVCCDSSSDSSYAFWDEKSPDRDANSLRKCIKQDELKKEKDFFKQDGPPIKGAEEVPENKSHVRRIQYVSKCGSLSRRTNRAELAEVCSSSSVMEKPAPKRRLQRPTTEPAFNRKFLCASYLKPLVQEKPTGRGSGTNNVKSKNKILLSKKTCVQTS